MPLLIPTAPLAPTTTEPRTVAFYGDQKIGKSETIAKLGELPGGLLHIDTHNGTAFIKTRRVDVGSLAGWHELTAALPAAWRASPFRWLAIDVLDDVETWATEQALMDYKRKPVGKNFGGLSVLELEMGLGFGYTRDALVEMLKPVWGNNWWTTIFVVHSRAKFLGFAESPTAVSADTTSDQLDLTGKIRKLICNKVDAVGHFSKKDGKLQLSFVTTEKTICGLRARYLHNKVVKFSDPARPEEWSAVWPETWNQPAKVAAPITTPPITTPTVAPTEPAAQPSTAPIAPIVKPAAPTSVPPPKPPEPPTAAK